MKRKAVNFFNYKKFQSFFGFPKMAKESIDPNILDHLIRIRVKDLRQMGFFAEPYKSGIVTITDTTCGKNNVVARLTVTVSTQFLNNSRCWLEYTTNGRPIESEIKLIAIPANLGGLIWYFICPVTSEKCWNLYKYGDYFIGRNAVENAYYEGQIVSKWLRPLRKRTNAIVRAKRGLDKMFEKGYTEMYAGEETKARQKATDGLKILQEVGMMPQTTETCIWSKIFPLVKEKSFPNKRLKTNCTKN